MPSRSLPLAILACMRPHQWVKNLLVAVPMLAAHRLRDSHAWLDIGLAFLAFSLAASAIYALNDVRDREADRAHPDKRRRPVASGDLSPVAAVWLFMALVIASVAPAHLLPRAFVAALIAYLGFAVAYSLLLKRLLMIDILTLALLYVIRLVAGGAATHVTLSPWLLAFCTFLFLSLAFAKRYAELGVVALQNDGSGAGAGIARARAYLPVDLDLIRTLGPVSGYLAVLVFALYINSPDAHAIYPRVAALWAVCPLLLYWITRLWFIVQRGRMHHDPIVFALTDPPSYVIAIGVIAAAAFASYPVQ